jgi:Glycosyltransferase family 10 (fucosyltransferase) C-term
MGERESSPLHQKGHWRRRLRRRFRVIFLPLAAVGVFVICGIRIKTQNVTPSALATRAERGPESKARSGVGEWNATDLGGYDYAHAPKRKPRRSPRHVYTCGPAPLFTREEPYANLAHALFPDAKTSFSNMLPFDESHPDDVLIWSCGPACSTSPMRNISARFPGTILTVNGEFNPEECTLGPARQGIYSLDGIGLVTDNSTFDASTKEASRTVFTYFSALELASRPKEQRQLIFDPIRRDVNNTGERFLIYAATRCVRFREEAFYNLSKVGEVYYGGPCNGSLASPSSREVGYADSEARNGYWLTNSVLFRRYRFALVMENSARAGYVTEKLVNAYLAGVVPIYFGTTEVFNLFNPRAFVFYNVSDPQPAIDRIAYLEANRTAYFSMLQEPITTYSAIARYFSFHDEDPGGGQLKWAIRDLIRFG